MNRLFLAAALLVLCSFRFYSFETEDAQVVRAAEKGLSEFVGRIPAGMQELYGFSATDDLKQCVVGRPYRTLSLNAKFLDGSISPNSHSNPYFVQLGIEWRVPVLIGGGCRTLLTVAGEDDNYNIVDLGGAQLARELQQKSMVAGKDDHFFILRVHPLTADFFAYSKTGSVSTATFVPLQSAVMAMPTVANKQSYTLDEVMIIISAAVKQPKN